MDYNDLLQKYKLQNWFTPVSYDQDRDLDSWRKAFFIRRVFDEGGLSDPQHFLDTIGSNPFYFHPDSHLPDHHSNTIACSNKFYFGSVKNLSAEDLFDFYHTYIRNSLGLPLTSENYWTKDKHLECWMRENRLRNNPDLVADIVKAVDDFEAKIPIVIDLNDPDSTIKKNFEQWLEDARDRFGKKVKNTPITSKQIQKWKELKILAYIDLKLWCKINKLKEPTNSQFETLLYSEVRIPVRNQDPGETVRRTIEPMANELMTGQLSKILSLTAAI